MCRLWPPPTASSCIFSLIVPEIMPTPVLRLRLELLLLVMAFP